MRMRLLKPHPRESTVQCSATAVTGIYTETLLLGTMEGSMKSLRKAFTGEEDTEKHYVRQAFDGFSCLSWKQKMIGFIVCILLAATFAILGCVLALLSQALFAVLFTIGTICGIASTLFLVGPISQAKKLCSSSDITASVIKLSCIVVLLLMIALVFCAVFWWDVAPVAVLFCVVEFIALIVYAITLIPFATTILSRGARGAWSTL